MTGKSYSIKEMKTIVDHLTENKLYGEIKGRKMWMDFANSSSTTRTWQSLKETFLKRILPDIHNPYYQLNMAQINSFRSGYDVSDKTKNKLELHQVSDDSGSKGPNQKETSKSNSDYGIKEEINAGEIIKCSNIAKSRSSADTVIVDTCYETAEDIQKDLESQSGEPENGETISLRDCITYSEPLTPMLQEVLDDFQSEPENEPEASDRETQMEIVNTDTVPDDTEETENTNKYEPKIVKENGKSNHVTNDTSKKSTDKDATVASGEDNTNPKPKENEANNKQGTGSQPPASNVQKEPEIVCLDDSPSEKNGEQNTVEKKTNNKTKEITKTPIANNDENLVDNNSENTDVVTVHDSNSEIIQPSGGLSNSNITDASLPNNPEAFKKRLSNEEVAEKSAEKVIENLPPPKSISGNKVIRKRSNSEDTAKNAGNKITKLRKTKSKATSETEGTKNMETIAEGKAKSVKLISKQEEVKVTSNNKDKDVPQDDVIVESLANNLEKPSTSITNDNDKVILSSDTSGQMNHSSDIKNPCLQNVSLFDEQFNKLKYATSESEVDQNKKKNEEIKDKNSQENQNDVVLLKSNTESDSEVVRPPPTKKQRAGVVSTKTDRDKALANVFGFSGGASYSKRKRQLCRRRRTISQNNVSHNNGGSGSSEWTSESESEVYVSPPRSRKNRHTRKYLKPQSGRILSLEEEGGLFVMYGKKIYPLVKDGKLVKNYLTYLPESDSEEERNYWRIKYEEEKKKADELKKLLKKTKEPHSRRSASNIVQPNPLRNSSSSPNEPENNEICLQRLEEKKVETKPNVAENIKIKFTTKNDQEIHLEGNWPQIHNVLEHVVQIFQKEPQPVSDSRSKVLAEPPSSSGIATPVIITPLQEPAVDPEVHEKVNKIESEIFKEIEERDKEEQIEPEGQDVNVTKRKLGRPRKSSPSSAAQSPAKRLKTATESPTKEPELNTVNEKTVSEPASDVTIETAKRQSRTPRRNLNESIKGNEIKTIQTRRSKLSISEVGKENGEEDDNVRYMFPPKTRRATKNTKPQKSMAKAPKIFSSPETICSNSMESTQGYQDSDPSPLKMELRKKKKTNLSEYKAKTKSHARRSTIKKNNPILYCHESSNSSVCDSIKKIERDNSTLNTDVYRSESYQLLMPFRQLDPIDETSTIKNKVDHIKHLDSTDKNEVFSVQMSSDIGSSSNISLPLSPELSVVESLSVSKEMLSGIDINGPTINEMQCDENIVPTTCSQYLISDIDVSVPLMQQECGLESCNEVDNKHKSLVTNSLLNKIGNCNIKDQTTITETLDAKLRDLLLESAKKIATQSEQTINMDVDETNAEVPKKVKNKNRCSTPRKRKVSEKSKKAPKVPPVVEEEHVESYSKGGRKSCPPIIEANPLKLNTVNEEIKIADLTINDNTKPKGRKKKDIIKVKILKPKRKKSHSDTTKSVQDSKKSIVNDSGINETESEVFLRGEDSVDLIHNHSETCLHTNDCVRDSIEFVENSMKSILTLSDSNQSYDNMLWNNESGFDKAMSISPDFFCNNAQDVKGFFNINSNGLEKVTTPKTDSSLITEDLSDDPPEPPVRRNKWYLLSEDENTNTNMENTQNPLANFGANLQQIFPITCAVPDLSTITEMSNENSRKPMMEGIGDTLDSQMLDSNF